MPDDRFNRRPASEFFTWMLSRGAQVEWAVAFDGAVKAALERGDAEGLVRLHREHPYGGMVHPTAAWSTLRRNTTCR